MSIFNGAMGTKWRSRIYVDLLAGPGRCVSNETGEEFDGSPILALTLEKPFSDLVFVEGAADLASALRNRVQLHRSPRDELVLNGDANSPTVISAVRQRCGRRSLVLTFVDFLGLEVTFKTLAQLTAGLHMDLLLTFQVNDLTRNVPLVLAGKQTPERLDAFFGTPGWRDVVTRFDSAATRAPDLASALTDYYCDRLGTMGYGYVAQLHRLMRNRTSAPLYRLILASRHHRAPDLFRKISRIEHSGQRGLFQ